MTCIISSISEEVQHLIYMKLFFILATCACPEIIYSNFIHIPPFISVNIRNSSDVSGFFPEFMTAILNQVCVHCNAYKSKIYYDRTGAGYPSKKTSMKDVKATVDEGTHMNFPFFGRFEVERFAGFYPYIGIMQTQGVAMLVVDEKVKTVGMVQILMSISKAWSVLCIGVLMCFVCGWLFWFLVSFILILPRIILSKLQQHCLFYFGIS